MTLEIGDVFLVRDFSNTGYDPHYQVVVHKTSNNDLILVYPTTKTDKAKRACCRDEKLPISGGNPITYVEMQAGSCPALPKLCAINCNKAFLKSEKDCILGFDFNKKEGKLDIEIINKIKEGIISSITVDEFVKLAFNK